MIETFYDVMRRQGIIAPQLPQVLQPDRGVARAWAPPARQQIAHAMETKPRTPVIWLHGLECTCCSESFIRSAHPLAKDVVLSMISLDYDDTLMAAAGHQAEAALERDDDEVQGQLHPRRRRQPAARPTTASTASPAASPSSRSCKHVAKDAKAIIAWGSLRVLGLRAGGEAESDAARRRSTRSSPTSRSSRCRAARRSPR